MNAAIPDPGDIGKLFIGGLSSVTTKESLENYFSQFGEVVDSVVMKNVETGRSRGFGFITFKDPNCVHKALQKRNHELDGKKIDPKECTPRSMQKVRKQAGKCKIFMGGLPPDVTEEAIRNGMSKFGKVDQVVIMYDQETKKCRGFGFLSFELEESIDQACAERFVIINGKQVELKKAEPRINTKHISQSFIMHKNQNGVTRQSSYGQMAPMQLSNWSISPTLFNFQGTSAANFPSYGTSAIAPFSVASPGYPSVQPLSYMQQYPSNFGMSIGSYNYSPASANTLMNNAQTCDTGGSNNTYAAENEKINGSGNGTQLSSYGPVKGTYISGNASDVSFNQGVTSVSTYQRYHPYKV